MSENDPTKNDPEKIRIQNIEDDLAKMKAEGVQRSASKDLQIFEEEFLDKDPTKEQEQEKEDPIAAYNRRRAEKIAKEQEKLPPPEEYEEYKVKPQEPSEDPSEEQLKKKIRNLTRKDCNLFVDILVDKYSGRPMSQPDDADDNADMYQDIYKQRNGQFYDDKDNLKIKKYKHSNFNMTISRDGELLEEYNNADQKLKILIDNLLNNPDAPRIPLNDEILENIQFKVESPPIVENNLNINAILFKILDRVSNEMSQINKIFLNGEIIYDEETVKSIIDKENLFDPSDSSIKRGASYYKYLTQLQANVINQEEYRTEDNMLHKIYDKLNEVTPNISNEEFNKYFIEILSALIFFSDLTVNKLTQKLMNTFNLDYNNINFKFSIARVINGPDGNPIIDVSQVVSKNARYIDELLNLSQNTKKMSQLFGIEPEKVKNELFTNTIEIFIEQNADIIINKTFTSFFYLNDNIYSLSLFKYTWNLNKNTCTIDVKYRWVIDDIKLSKLINNYVKILSDLLKITNLPITNKNYLFLNTESENSFYNFKNYIINCIKILKCILKGDKLIETGEQSSEHSDEQSNELDYSSSNQEIEGKFGQKLNKAKEKYSELKEDYPKTVTTAKIGIGFGVTTGLAVAGLALAGMAVLGGKKSKKNMKINRKNKNKKTTRNHKKQNKSKKERKIKKTKKQMKIKSKKQIKSKKFIYISPK